MIAAKIFLFISNPPFLFSLSFCLFIFQPFYHTTSAKGAQEKKVQKELTHNSRAAHLRHFFWSSPQIGQKAKSKKERPKNRIAGGMTR